MLIFIDNFFSSVIGDVGYEEEYLNFVTPTNVTLRRPSHYDAVLQSRKKNKKLHVVINMESLAKDFEVAAVELGGHNFTNIPRFQSDAQSSVGSELLELFNNCLVLNNVSFYSPSMRYVLHLFLSHFTTKKRIQHFSRKKW